MHDVFSEKNPGPANKADRQNSQAGVSAAKAEYPAGRPDRSVIRLEK